LILLHVVAYVSIGFVPVDDAAAMLRVDSHISSSVRGAAIVNSCGLDSFEDRIEFFLLYAEAVVKDRKRLCSFIKIECQPIIYVHWRERACLA
jgi:hypothetical protein